MLFGYLTLFVALTLSLVAAYYSVAGLTAIFAAAVVPIVIMGAALEVGKVTATVWLHKNWERSPFLYKAYLVPAVAFLMLLTSMGIFGFLSKAHSDQSLVSGDSMAKIAIYDEKIRIAKDNIDANRKALKQMDEAVDQVMGRSQDEKGADKAVAIRRGQQKERARLLAEITAEQKTITQLNEDAAPLRAENRKVEAEVGPIKYIAALLYGDNPDSNVLERAVRWVIILIVVVFDPLALVLILAGTRHLEWTEEDKDAEVEGFFTRARHHAQQLDAEAAEAKLQDDKDDVCANETTETVVDLNPSAPPEEEFDISKHPYLFNVPDRRTPPGIEPVGPMVYKPEEEPYEEFTEDDAMRLSEEELAELYAHLDEMEADYPPDDGPLTPEVIEAVQESAKQEMPTGEIVKEEHLFEKPVQEIDPGFVYQPQEPRPITDFPELQEAIRAGLADGSIVVQGATDPVEEPKILTLGIDPVERPGDYLPEAAPTLKVKTETPPEAAKPQPKAVVKVAETKNVYKELTADTGLTADNDPSPTEEVKAHFGTSFPPTPDRGEMYLRVDYLPSRLFKFNGNKWIEIEKELTDTYLYNEEYIKYLIDEISAGRFDADDLSDSERQQIADFLANEQSNNSTGS